MTVRHGAQSATAVTKKLPPPLSQNDIREGRSFARKLLSVDYLFRERFRLGARGLPDLGSYEQAESKGRCRIGTETASPVDSCCPAYTKLLTRLIARLGSGLQLGSIGQLQVWAAIQVRVDKG